MGSRFETVTRSTRSCPAKPNLPKSRTYKATMEMKLSLFALVCLLCLVERSSSLSVYGRDIDHQEVETVHFVPLDHSQESLVPKVRSKRTISSIGNLLAINLFPVPILPTNFIGLQVTIVPPKNRNSRRRG